MTPLFKKLNYKDHEEIIVLNAPLGFSQEQADISTLAKVETSEKPKEFDFLIAFVSQQASLDNIAKTWCPLGKGDAILWFVYPKKSSKNYKCEFNRDNGWQVLGDLGWEGVRLVSIDHDWSALRFRKVSYIKTMIRSFAMTDEGKVKAGK